MGEEFNLNNFAFLVRGHLDNPEFIIRHLEYQRARSFLQTKKSNVEETEQFFVTQAEELKNNDEALTGKTWHSLLDASFNAIQPLRSQKKMSLAMMKLVLRFYFELLKLDSNSQSTSARYPPNQANPMVANLLLEANHLAYFVLVLSTMSNHKSRVHLRGFEGLPHAKHFFHPSSLGRTGLGYNGEELYALICGFQKSVKDLDGQVAKALINESTVTREFHDECIELDKLCDKFTAIRSPRQPDMLDFGSIQSRQSTSVSSSSSTSSSRDASGKRTLDTTTNFGQTVDERTVSSAPASGRPMGTGSKKSRSTGSNNLSDDEEDNGNWDEEDNGCNWDDDASSIRLQKLGGKKKKQSIAQEKQATYLAEMKQQEADQKKESDNLSALLSVLEKDSKAQQNDMASFMGIITAVLTNTNQVSSNNSGLATPGSQSSNPISTPATTIPCSTPCSSADFIALYDNLEQSEEDKNILDANNIPSFKSKYLELTTSFYNNLTKITYAAKTRCLFKRRSERTGKFIVDINGTAMNISPENFHLGNTEQIPSPENI